MSRAAPASLRDRLRSGARAGCAWLTRERPTWMLVCVSLALGAVHCLLQFDLGFLAGTSPFWRDPHGLMPNSWADMSTALSGYDWFQRDSWRLPLFRAAAMRVPRGNVIFTDSVPVAALIGRLAFRLTGETVNLLGAWTAACLVAAGAAMAALVARLGGRGIAACLAATLFGLCAPALLIRWGHIALMAQAEVILALLAYLEAVRGARPWRGLGSGVALCALALWTHAYLFAMVAAVVASALAQLLVDRRLRPATGALVAAAASACLALLALASGYADGGSAPGAGGFGVFSANALSPWLPQGRVLGPLLFGERPVDRTGGQYEGYCYLGAGMLVLMAAARGALATCVRAGLRRHACLAAALAACTAFALSDTVFVGGLRLVHVPLPNAALQLASVFRASGRFTWPAMYLGMALAIATAASARRWDPPRTVALLAAAALLQWFDTSHLRASMAWTTRSPAAVPSVDAEAWTAALARHEFLRVVPAFGCRNDAPRLATRVLMLAQLASSRADVPTNSIYVARGEPDCAAPPDEPPPGELTLRWAASGVALPATGDGSDASCSTAGGLAVCSARLSAAERLSLLRLRGGAGAP